MFEQLLLQIEIEIEKEKEREREREREIEKDLVAYFEVKETIVTFPSCS